MSKPLFSAGETLSAVGVAAVVAMVIMALTGQSPESGPFAEPSGSASRPAPISSSKPVYKITVLFATDADSARAYELRSLTVKTTGVFDPPQPPPNRKLRRIEDNTYQYEAAGTYREGPGTHGSVAVKASFKPAKDPDDPKHADDQLSCFITAGAREDDDTAVGLLGDHDVAGEVKY